MEGHRSTGQGSERAVEPLEEEEEGACVYGPAGWELHKIKFTEKFRNASNPVFLYFCLYKLRKSI
jgi:hypothetical protein